MDHDEILHALDEYVEGLLGPHDRDAVEEHLKTCSSCSLSLEELKKTVGHVRSLEEVPAPPWLLQRIMARVRERAERKHLHALARFFGSFRFPLRALALLFLTVTAFLGYRYMHPGDRISEPARSKIEAPVSTTEPGTGPGAGETTTPQTPTQGSRDKQLPAAPHSNEAGIPSGGALGGAERAVPVAPQAQEAGTVRNGAEDRHVPAAETKGIMMVIKIRARGTSSLAQVEETVRSAGGTVVNRDVSADAWILTLQIDPSKHAALLDGLRRVGKAEERILAVDGQERREIFMQGAGKPKAAVGC